MKMGMCWLITAGCRLPWGDMHVLAHYCGVSFAMGGYACAGSLLRGVVCHGGICMWAHYCGVSFAMGGYACGLITEGCCPLDYTLRSIVYRFGCCAMTWLTRSLLSTCSCSTILSRVCDFVG